VPVDEAFRRIVATLREGREVEYGLLGVYLESLGDRGGLLGQEAQGALVREAMPGGPADRAGLRPGDVITRAGQAPVFSSDALMLAVSKLPPLATIEIRFLRLDREQTARVELSKAQPHGEQIVTAPTQTWRGLRVDFATAVENYATAARQGGIDPDGCVAVRHVEPQSPAWKAGLRAGTFISRIAERQVQTPDEFYAAAAEASGEVVLQIPQPDRPQQVTIEAT
jgi:S1-C subfamily serine protease